MHAFGGLDSVHSPSIVCSLVTRFAIYDRTFHLHAGGALPKVHALLCYAASLRESWPLPDKFQYLGFKAESGAL